MNFRISLCATGWYSILFTEPLPNSAVPYYEQYYNTFHLVLWLISKF